MSTLITSDAKQRSRARLADRLVLLELADEAGHDGWVLIKVKTISTHTLLGPSTVLKSLKGLEAAGEIERYSGKKRGQASCYRVLLSDSRGKGEELPDRLARLRGVSRIETPRYPGSRGGVSRIERGGIQDRDTPISKDSPGSSPGISPVPAAPAEDWVHHLTDREIPSGWAPLARPWCWSTPTGDRDQLFDTVCLVCRRDTATLTKSERGRLNAAVKELRDVGASPGEVKARARRWPTLWRTPTPELTPTALTAWWSRLAADQVEEVKTHRCPPHRWVDMDDDPRGRYCLACRTWEKEDRP